MYSCPTRNTACLYARWLSGYPALLPPKRSEFNPRSGHSGFSHVGNVQTMFSRGISHFPALSFRRCSILTSITLIGSQDLDICTRENQGAAPPGIEPVSPGWESCNLSQHTTKTSSADQGSNDRRMKVLISQHVQIWMTLCHANSPLNGAPTFCTDDEHTPAARGGRSQRSAPPTAEVCREIHPPPLPNLCDLQPHSTLHPRQHVFVASCTHIAATNNYRSSPIRIHVHPDDLIRRRNISRKVRTIADLETVSRCQVGERCQSQARVARVILPPRLSLEHIQEELLRGAADVVLMEGRESSTLRTHTPAKWRPCPAKFSNAVSQSAPGNIVASGRPANKAPFLILGYCAVNTPECVKTMQTLLIGDDFPGLLPFPRYRILSLGSRCKLHGEGGLGKESAMAFVREPFQHSPGVISENLNQDGRTGNLTRVFPNAGVSTSGENVTRLATAQGPQARLLMLS
ncbi:hypothetical protein PR048_014162 [Dryococelus australis]|uniref:Uncharacterized protein n=1 Tax=Dryococelus australis TaxID=614101 RepID=A0ABQ9HDJ6_9NEOP|nr:hypothetical protein PR048_014162 [Dryococelus australis]